MLYWTGSGIPTSYSATQKLMPNQKLTLYVNVPIKLNKSTVEIHINLRDIKAYQYYTTWSFSKSIKMRGKWQWRKKQNFFERFLKCLQMLYISEKALQLLHNTYHIHSTDQDWDQPTEKAASGKTSQISFIWEWNFLKKNAARLNIVCQIMSFIANI